VPIFYVWPMLTNFIKGVSPAVTQMLEIMKQNPGLLGESHVEPYSATCILYLLLGA
jgi:hypothetical protein